jgi:hypothetical protein
MPRVLQCLQTVDKCLVCLYNGRIGVCLADNVIRQTQTLCLCLSDEHPDQHSSRSDYLGEWIQTSLTSRNTFNSFILITIDKDIAVQKLSFKVEMSAHGL